MLPRTASIVIVFVATCYGLSIELRTNRTDNQDQPEHVDDGFDPFDIVYVVERENLTATANNQTLLESFHEDQPHLMVATNQAPEAQVAATSFSFKLPEPLIGMVEILTLLGEMILPINPFTLGWIKGYSIDAIGSNSSCIEDATNCITSD